MLISALKIIFLLGFLIFIHEGGHFLVAKLCKVKVNEFAIGFGPTIFKRQTKETKYAVRLIPLGGFVSMEGEEEQSDNEGSFSKASIPRRMAIVAAGAIVNIVFGLIVYFILIAVVYGDLTIALRATGGFIISLGESIKMLFTGGVGVNDLSGPVGISGVVAQTTNIVNYLYILAVISISLGVTNLLPIPALDGGKILILVIEAIRRKPLKQETEIQIQLLGFSLIIALSLYVTYNDVLRIFS
ncbi:MAG: site-2 protease family protein [Clostridia bacterium]|nr:site-2 protease family protein [Clostridia bacterium]